MKKLLVVITAVLLTVPVFAENPAAKGNFVITLPLAHYWMGFGDKYKAGSDKQNDWSIGTEGYEVGAQYFVIDSLAVGGAISYGQDKFGSTAASKTFVFMPEVSYYFPIGEIVPFASISYYYSKESVASTKTQSLPIKIGVAYQVSKVLAPYISASYSVIDKGTNVATNATDQKGNKLTFELGIKAFF